MQIQVNTDNQISGGAELTRQVEIAVKGALGHFGDRITRVEVHLSDENSSHKFADKDKRCVMEARLAGLQPIAASHHGSSLEQAINGAASTLEKTLKRALGRKNSLFKRRARVRAEFTAVDPMLQRDASNGKQEEFLTLLRPLLGHLRDHALRELRTLEANDVLSRGQLAAADLLNEVMTRAWLRFADRPRQMPLDLWLTSLLDETLDEKFQPVPGMNQSLDQHVDEVTAADVPQVDDQKWWVWLLGEDETITLGDTIASDEIDPAARQLEAEELQERVHALLGALPKARRQAFTLSLLEGYDLGEIAMLQDRPETEVQHDIEAACNALREQLPAGSQ